MTIRKNDPSTDAGAATAPTGTREAAEVLALQALGWTLSEEDRAERFLALTGIGPDTLRANLGDRFVLAAVLDFLAGHEPDLVEAADALGVRPEAVMAARQHLQGAITGAHETEGGRAMWDWQP